MYYRDNSEDYNEKINTDGHDDHDVDYEEKINTDGRDDDYNEDDYDYEEFFQGMPYYREQISYLPHMNYQMMYFNPMMCNMPKRNEEDVEDLERKNHDHGYNHHCKDCGHHGHCMPMMNMPMYENQMPVFEEYDEDLKSMYPKSYIKIYPMVKYHCDMMESRYGTLYCPSKNEMDHICKEICDKYEEDHNDDDEDDRNDDMRQGPRQGRGGLIQDLARILFIRELFGRRRRRMFHHGY